MKTLTLLSLLFLFSGCAAILEDDVSHFRAQALQCPGHVVLDVSQIKGEQTLHFHCEWGTLKDEPQEVNPFEEVI